MSNSIARSLTAAAAVAILAGTVSAARLEPLAAPVPVTVPPPVVFGALPTPFPSLAPVPAPASPEAQKPAPTLPQSRPLSPDDDFAKGAYAQDTPGLILPVVTRSERPRYTAEAMRAKLQGDIHLEIVVGHEGYVTRARVAGVSGDLEFLGLDTKVEPARRNLGLDEQALAAIRQWRFEPATLNGVGVPVLTRVYLSFRLF